MNIDHYLSKKNILFIFTISLFFLSTIFHVKASDFKPAIVYNIGGKDDRSFGEAASKGIERFKQETKINYKEFEITNETQREQAIRKLAARSDHVYVIAFGFVTPLKNVAPEFPNKKFTIIDAVVDLPNVESIVFKEHEGSFLVGMIAALKSKSGKVGFVGGMESPLIRKFELGYLEGAKYVNPNIEVLRNMTGSTPTAWNDPTRGGELAKSQIDRGVDVIFAAAGGTGLGVYQVAAENNIYAIGVDSNQNYLHPGHMLTSMLKRVDNAIYTSLMNSKTGKFKSGLITLGLAENGVDFAIDEYNKKLIEEDTLTKVKTAKSDIISGKLKVTNYMDNNKNNLQ